VKLKNICNFYSLLKKNSNQKDIDQMWMKRKLKELVWNCEGADTKFEEERREKKKKWW
jgi:hypothetical protein